MVELSLIEISRLRQDLIDRARGRKLGQSEAEGGTSTLSNFGGYGGDFEQPLLSPPPSGRVALSRTAMPGGSLMGRPPPRWLRSVTQSPMGSSRSPVLSAMRGYGSIPAARRAFPHLDADQRFDVIDSNEAFAAQALAVSRERGDGRDPDRQGDPLFEDNRRRIRDGVHVYEERAGDCPGVREILTSRASSAIRSASSTIVGG